MGYVLCGIAWYVVTIASLVESWNIYYIAFIHIHLRHTNVSAPSILISAELRFSPSDHITTCCNGVRMCI